MAMSEIPAPAARTVSGRSARFAASIFHYGNIAAMLVPLPLGIFWMGASMLVFAMNRHHPNPQVGHYTQRAAWRLYGVVGLVLVLATFFGTDVTAWLVAWALSAAVIVPWSVLDLVRIRRAAWQDVALTPEHA